VTHASFPREKVKNMRECRKCGQAKEPGLFPWNPARTDGLSSWCKACHADAVRRTRAKKAARAAERAEVLRLEINQRLREQECR
jgi:hypothetical protein